MFPGWLLTASAWGEQRCVSAWTPIWGPNLTWTAAVADSHQPGEMMATAQTFGQTLQRGGMNWHDFAALVSGEGERLVAPAFTFATLGPACPGNRSPSC